MAHGLPARVGENVSDECVEKCQGTVVETSGENKKHRKIPTMQAENFLSVDWPLTVLGSSMMVHHCLRLRDLRAHYSIGLFQTARIIEHIFVYVKRYFQIFEKNHRALVHVVPGDTVPR